MSNQETIRMMAEAQIREPKSAQGVFTLPCGFLAADGVLHTEVELREINGKDEDMLGSKQVPDSKKLGQLIASCITRLGTITDKGVIAAAVPEMLIGDRVFLTLAIRRTSLGDSYPYSDKCPSCERESLMSIDLSQVEASPMPEPKKRIFDARLPSPRATREWAEHGEVPEPEKSNPTGHTVRFRPLNGRDEESFGRIATKEAALSLTLQTRIELLDGKPPTIDALQALSATERAYIRDVIFDQADGGIETTLDVTCPLCSHDYRRELELELGFFFPSVARKNWKTRSST